MKLLLKDKLNISDPDLECTTCKDSSSASYLSLEKKLYCGKCYEQSIQVQDREIYEKIVNQDRDWSNLYD